MEFLGMTDYQEKSEVFLGSRRLLQRSYTSLRRDFSNVNRPCEEKRGDISSRARRRSVSTPF